MDYEITTMHLTPPPLNKINSCFRLGENPYMFGKSPSRLDAVMYGYLAPLLKE